MPRKGASQGVRALRWAVSLTPAELALVETVRVGWGGRAEWLLAAARGAVERAAVADVPPTWLRGARAALVRLAAEDEARDDALTAWEEDTRRDRYKRGGSKPRPHRLAALDAQGTLDE